MIQSIKKIMAKLPFSIIITLILSSFYLTAQDYSNFDCPVEVNGRQLAFPWTGGFNSPQFSSGDMDGDGKEELFVFDRGGNVPMIFERSTSGGNSNFIYRPDMKANLPDSLESWALLRDYNEDGIADLFVAPTFGNVPGVQLYEGSIENGKPTYTIKRMGNSTGPFQIIWYRFGSSWVNVTIPTSDIPEIIDVDGDSDLDILSFDLEGSQVTYYKNLQKEQDLPNDTMVYEATDFCFGKFKESGLSGEIFLSDADDQCASKLNDDELVIRGGAHAGSTIMCFDNDNDGDLEMLLGDLSGTNVVYLENGGSSERNHYTEVSYAFPDYDVPVDLDIFLGTFNVDVDNDGLKDIITAPNSINSVQNVDNIWLYKNTDNEDTRFRFIQEDFLQEETLDFGSNSVPVFIDEDADGLMDLLVASSGHYSDSAEEIIFLALFRNVGTEFNPSFKLEDLDYLNFREYSGSSDDPSPAAGDLDGDGDIDILIADTNELLYYFENTAGPDSPMAFASPVVGYMGINPGVRGFPAIVDINADGLNDIVMGDYKVNGNFQDPNVTTWGSLAYYQNQGEIGEPFFNGDESVAPNIPNLGQIRTQLGKSNAELNNSSPNFIKVEGELQVLIGSEAGKIKRYAIDCKNLSSKFEVLDSIVGNIDEGKLSTLASYDIDRDGFLELVVGNLRGGLSFYNTDIMSEFSDTEDLNPELTVTVYPNPTSDKICLDIPDEIMITSMRIIGNEGKVLQEYERAYETIDLSDYPTGVYFLELTTREKSITKKVLKL